MCTNEEIGQDRRAGTAGAPVSLEHFACQEQRRPRQLGHGEPAADQKRLKVFDLGGSTPRRNPCH